MSARKIWWEMEIHRRIETLLMTASLKSAKALLRREVEYCRWLTLFNTDDGNIWYKQKIYLRIETIQSILMKVSVTSLPTMTTRELCQLEILGRIVTNPQDGSFNENAWSIGMWDIILRILIVTWSPERTFMWELNEYNLVVVFVVVVFLLLLLWYWAMLTAITVSVDVIYLLQV